MTRVFDILERVEAHQKADAIATKAFGEWQKTNAQTLINEIHQAALGLLSIGLEKDDKIALIGPSSKAWVVMDFAIQMAGGIVVPMYPTITAEDYAFIFSNADVKYVFVGSEEIHKKVKLALTKAASEALVYGLENLPGIPYWTTLISGHQQHLETGLKEISASIKPADLCTIIYTSGTTGSPKGVMLSHINILSSMAASAETMPLRPEMRALSFLPLCHIYERAAVYTYLNAGTSVYFAENIDTLSADLISAKPHVFTTVPRLIEKVYDKIIAKAHELSYLKKTIFFKALAFATRSDPQKPSKGFLASFYDKLVFKKWREALGGHIEYIISGSAAIQPRLVRVFTAAGIPILEGYGMTETSPGISMNMLSNIRLGSVGKILNIVDLKIAEDGEILVKGPNLMMGYYKNPTATKEAISVDGWLHTGDIGHVEQNQYLYITDRKKEIFKTSGGKYIAPQLIENKLKADSLIDQVMVLGEGQKYPAALIVSPGALEIDFKKIELAVAAVNQTLAQYEQIKKYKVLTVPWSVESGELTPTLKLKRKKIAEKYQEEIKDLWS